MSKIRLGGYYNLFKQAADSDKKMFDEIKREMDEAIKRENKAFGRREEAEFERLQRDLSPENMKLLDELFKSDPEFARRMEELSRDFAPSPESSVIPEDLDEDTANLPIPETPPAPESSGAPSPSERPQTPSGPAEKSYLDKILEPLKNIDWKQIGTYGAYGGGAGLGLWGLWDLIKGGPKQYKGYMKLLSALALAALPLLLSNVDFSKLFGQGGGGA